MLTQESSPVYFFSIYKKVVVAVGFVTVFPCVILIAPQTNVDVVRFPCGVLITEVRVIPPGIKAHTNLPDNRAFG